jgi:hypothetical protein
MDGCGEMFQAYVTLLHGHSDHTFIYVRVMDILTGYILIERQRGVGQQGIGRT